MRYLNIKQIQMKIQVKYFCEMLNFFWGIADFCFVKSYDAGINTKKNEISEIFPSFKITLGFPFSFVDWPTLPLDSGSNLPGMALSAPNVGPVSCLSGPNVLAPN